MLTRRLSQIIAPVDFGVISPFLHQCGHHHPRVRALTSAALTATPVALTQRPDCRFTMQPGLSAVTSLMRQCALLQVSSFSANVVLVMFAGALPFFVCRDRRRRVVSQPTPPVSEGRSVPDGEACHDPVAPPPIPTFLTVEKRRHTVGRFGRQDTFTGERVLGLTHVG